MSTTRAIVITGNGTNCEMEAAHACRLGGFDEARIVHIAEILSGEVRLDNYHFLNLTGGFLDGDDLGSAKAQANRLKNATISGGTEKLVEQFTRFINAGKLVLGVCNGFQLMVKMGMLPALDGNDLTQTVTLSHNEFWPVSGPLVLPESRSPIPLRLYQRDRTRDLPAGAPR